MAIPATYNFDPVPYGTTIEEKVFEFFENGLHPDITRADMHFKECNCADEPVVLELTSEGTGATLDVTTSPGCVIFTEQILDLEPGTWYYDIELVINDSDSVNDKKIYVKGYIQILEVCTNV